MKLSGYATLFCIIIYLSATPGCGFGQLSQGGVPISVSRAIAPDPDVVIVPPPTSQSLAIEHSGPQVPYSFAINIPVDFSIGNSGRWIATTGGTMVWRLNVSSPGALAMTLYFDRFSLPEGGRLFVYNSLRTQILGAFTSLNNNSLSTFATSLVHGDNLTIEYNAPEGTPLPVMHVSEVAWAFRGVTDYSQPNTGFGGSGTCEVNVNCTEGNGWQMQKRGVTRIQIKRTGMPDAWCTGSLVNNVRNNGTPYVLTADHCGRFSSATDISQWIFYFNYEGPGCTDPANEPVLHSLTGSKMIAHGGNSGSSGSDFFLVLLNSQVPGSWNTYFNGWSRETEIPSPSGTSIHHPQGDIKKISTYSKPLKQTYWTGGSKLAHWEVTWAQTENGHGTTEPGSSGSPLFDNLGRLVGTLTGGDSSCDSVKLNLPDYYGMFSYSWDKNGTDSTAVLKYWLDPDSTNVMSLNGWALDVPEKGIPEWVSVYPNPVSNELNIRTGMVGGASFHVGFYNILGNLIMAKELHAGVNGLITVDLSDFAPGMYILRVGEADNVVVRKIFKQ